jgi:hypothetical protein
VFTKTTAARIGLLGLIAASGLALSSCKGRDPAQPDKPTEDPALTSPLQSQIMVDPDLAEQSHAGSALAGGGPPTMEVPTIETGREAVTAAKDEAAKLAGKSIASVPVPSGKVDMAAAEAITPAQLARLVKGPGTRCAAKLAYGAAWSLRLPAALPIYPRGHVQEAAGVDKDGCQLRVVSFLTPVEPDQVLAFYQALGKKAGASITLTKSDAVQALVGDKRGLSFLIRTRKQSAEVSSVDLVVNGGS